MDEFDHLIIKIVWLVVIFAVGLGGGLIAFKAHKRARREVIFSLGSTLAAGVFLGAGTIHLLGDGMEALDSYFTATDFPLALLLAALGIVVVLFIEKVVFGNFHEHERGGGGGGVPVSPYALAVVLSIHSVIAGAALGSEGTFVGSLVIFVAIIAHKGAAAFALIVDFQRNGLPLTQITRVLVLFASMTPLGVVLGAVLDRLLAASYGRLFEGIFDSLAAGTFIYVALLEIIGKEFADKTRIVPKFAALSAGLALMALIAVWV